MTAFFDLPEALSQIDLAVLVGTSFAGSFVSAALGLGGGVLLLAVMAVILPPIALVPLHGVVQLFSNVFRCLLLVRHVSWSPVLGFVLGGVVGAGLGGTIAVSVPAGILPLAVGVFILWSILAKPPAWLARWPWLTGGVSSLLTMFVGATGPFVATYIRAQNLTRLGTVSTHALLMTFQHALKILVFGLFGFVFTPWLGVIALMVAAGVFGTVIGKRVLLRMSDQLFRRALDILLVCLSLRLMWQGARSLAY